METRGMIRFQGMLRHPGPAGIPSERVEAYEARMDMLDVSR